ncbi:uncharacterized protein LOC111947761 isoform X2 [Oryzias latipes]|uniref:uncharacterized protein LOC111947761 isoform X2 n=1 Tax=Oryzias latipes TaxID=8090 RepID=UPI000CE1ED17|nr:uncharacterized protein LOC111947761 isoform X2 [Oryzias latipes]
MSAAQQDFFRRLDCITHTLTELTGQASTVSVTTQAPASGNSFTSASAVTPENFRLQPEPFSGDVTACGGFLLQCQLIFQQAPRHYQTDQSRIALIVNSLRNKALQWAQAFLAAHPISHLPFDRFIEEFRLVFDQPRKQEEATRRLLNLKQGNRSPSDLISGYENVTLNGALDLRAFFKTLFHPTMWSRYLLTSHQLPHQTNQCKNRLHHKGTSGRRPLLSLLILLLGLSRSHALWFILPQTSSQPPRRIKNLVLYSPPVN